MDAARDNTVPTDKLGLSCDKLSSTEQVAFNRWVGVGEGVGVMVESSGNKANSVFN